MLHEGLVIFLILSRSLKSKQLYMLHQTLPSGYPAEAGRGCADITPGGLLHTGVYVYPVERR